MSATNSEEQCTLPSRNSKIAKVFVGLASFLALLAEREHQPVNKHGSSPSLGEEPLII
jgi:hypothetical protein